MLKTAFSDSAIKRIFAPWEKAIKNRECLSVINIPKRDQLYRLDEIGRIKSLKTGSQIITIDLAGEIIEDKQDLDNLIKLKRSKNKISFTLVILDADLFLSEKMTVLAALNKLYHENRNCNIIYLFRRNITSIQITDKLGHYSSLYQNIAPFYFLTEEKPHFLAFLENSFLLKISLKLKNLILKQCANSPWLIKEVVRQYQMSENTEKIFEQDNIRLKLSILYREFTSEEKNILEKIVRNETTYTIEDREILNYLQKVNVIYKTEKRIKLTIPLLESYIKEKLNNKMQINVNPLNQILINGVIMEGYFSRGEKRIINVLLKNKNKVISRENIAAAVWKNEKILSYTDWALDQLIKRLRRKLVGLGLSKNLISTIKNRGYWISAYD